jgi:hypothetical protein
MFADLVTLIDRAAQELLGGTPVVYVTKDGVTVDPAPVGIFDKAYVLTDPSNAGVEQVGPVLWLRLEDLPVDPELDDPRITIEGQDYVVHARQKDGVGGSVRLLLHEAEPIAEAYPDGPVASLGVTDSTPSPTDTPLGETLNRLGMLG